MKDAEVSLGNLFTYSDLQHPPVLDGCSVLGHLVPCGQSSGSGSGGGAAVPWTPRSAGLRGFAGSGGPALRNYELGL